MTLKPGERVVITGNPGRNAADHWLRAQTIVRPKDGWKWTVNGGINAVTPRSRSSRFPRLRFPASRPTQTPAHFQTARAAARRRRRPPDAPAMVIGRRLRARTFDAPHAELPALIRELDPRRDGAAVVEHLDIDLAERRSIVEPDRVATSARHRSKTPRRTVPGRSSPRTRRPRHRLPCALTDRPVHRARLDHASRRCGPACRRSTRPSRSVRRRCRGFHHPSGCGRRAIGPSAVIATLVVQQSHTFVSMPRSEICFHCASHAP